MCAFIARICTMFYGTQFWTLNLLMWIKLFDNVLELIIMFSGNFQKRYQLLILGISANKDTIGKGYFANSTGCPWGKYKEIIWFKKTNYCIILLVFTDRNRLIAEIIKVRSGVADIGSRHNMVSPGLNWKTKHDCIKCSCFEHKNILSILLVKTLFLQHTC